MLVDPAEPTDHVETIDYVQPITRSLVSFLDTPHELHSFRSASCMALIFAQVPFGAQSASRERRILKLVTVCSAAPVGNARDI